MQTPDLERTKLETESRHILQDKDIHRSRLKSIKSFIKCRSILTKIPEQARIDCWKITIGNTKDNQISPSEHLEHFPAGHNLDWPAWRTLNRLRTRVGRSKDNLKKWDVLQEDTKCVCGDERMYYEPPLDLPKMPYKLHYLGSHNSDNKDATKVVKHWEGKI